VSSMREQYKTSLAERREDAEVEQDGLIAQGRMERRQLELATQLQRQAAEAEIQAQAESRAAVRAARSEQIQRRKFSQAFARTQNSMSRQLRMGEMRRGQQDSLIDTTVKVAATRQQAQVRSEAAAARKLRRAEAMRMNTAQFKSEINRELVKKQQAADRELDVLKFKKQQLREIRQMLARPIPSGSPIPGVDIEGDDELSNSGLVALSLLEGAPVAEGMAEGRARESIHIDLTSPPLMPAAGEQWDTDD